MNNSEYQFCVEGHVDPRWEDWFDGLSIAFDPNLNQTRISGTLPDQSALYGTIAKFRDLGLNLVFLARLPDRQV